MKGGDEMAGRRKWIVVLSVILVLLLIVAGLCYVKGWSFTGNKDGADEAEDDCGAVLNGRGCLRRAGRKPAGGFPDRRRASDRLRRR